MTTQNEGDLTPKEIEERMFAKMRQGAHIDMSDFHKRFPAEQAIEEYDRLQSRDDAYMGRFLTCHLLIEHYLNQYLFVAYPTLLGRVVRQLRFAVKADLVQGKAETLGPMLPGIKAMNSIRNKLAHDIEYFPTDADLRPVRQSLEACIGSTDKTGIELVEAFTLIAHTWIEGCYQLIQYVGKQEGYAGLLRYFREQAIKELLSERHTGVPE